MNVLAPRCPDCGWRREPVADLPENHAAARADVVAHKATCAARHPPAPDDDDEPLQCPHEAIPLTCGKGGCNCACDPCAPFRPAPDERAEGERGCRWSSARSRWEREIRPGVSKEACGHLGHGQPRAAARAALPAPDDQTETETCWRGECNRACYYPDVCSVRLAAARAAQPEGEGDDGPP